MVLIERGSIDDFLNQCTKAVLIDMIGGLYRAMQRECRDKPLLLLRKGVRKLPMLSFTNGL